MIEIYNESVYDLLSNEVEGSTKVTAAGPEATGISVFAVHDRSDLDVYMATGAANRAEAATLVNAHSSRSHW